LRRGVRNVIAENPRFHVVAEASDGHEALKLVSELNPDIAIIDLPPEAAAEIAPTFRPTL